MEEAAEKHLDSLIPKNTKRGYANDWALWGEFHAWLAERTDHALPLTAVTKGTLVGFVVWLDTIKLAAPNSIDRRITGVTVTSPLGDLTATAGVPLAEQVNALAATGLDTADLATTRRCLLVMLDNLAHDEHAGGESQT